MQIAIPLYDRFTALDAIGPYEVLSRIPGADAEVPRHRGRALHDRQRDAHDPGRGLARRHAAAGHPVRARRLGHARRRCPTSAWSAGSADAHETSQWTTSVCTGSLLLGAAGMLEGLEATSHWLRARDAARDGREADRAARGASRARSSPPPACPSGIDMALTLLAEISGRRVRADDPARHRVRPPAAVRLRLAEQGVAADRGQPRAGRAPRVRRAARWATIRGVLRHLPWSPSEHSFDLRVVDRTVPSTRAAPVCGDFVAVPVAVATAATWSVTP